MVGAPVDGGGITGSRAINPARILVLAFAGAISIGTCLLMLPVASKPEATVSWSDALFTAASAVCVTGLTVVDTGQTWSWFGQAVIWILMHIGGLGLMTTSTLIAAMLGKRITFRERLITSAALNQVSVTGVVRLTRYIFATALLLEGAAACLLAWRWSLYFDTPTAIWLGIFHAGSAFNNAGFDLFGNSLRNYAADLGILVPIALLIVGGGLGFSVLVELARMVRNRLRWHQLTLHTRAVIAATLFLIGLGTVAFFTLEFNNPHTLQPLTYKDKVVVALFTAISSRTAGFSSLPIESMSAPSLLLISILMFIGGSPGSTAGGIKTTTALAILAAVRSTLSGHKDVVLFRRRLDRGITDRALAVTVVAFLALVTLVVVLLVLENSSLLSTIFEVTSALGTAGLTVGLTPQLSTAGRLLMVLAMFAGRIGPLTLAFALARRQRAAVAIRYPEDRLMIG